MIQSEWYVQRGLNHNLAVILLVLLDFQSGRNCDVGFRPDPWCALQPWAVSVHVRQSQQQHLLIWNSTRIQLHIFLEIILWAAIYIYINCKYDRYTHMNSESSFINGGWYWLVNLPAGPPGGRTRPSTELDDLARVTLLSNQAGVAYGNLGEVACSSLHKKFLLILKLLAVLAVTSGIWLVSLEACSSQVKVL